MQAQRWGEQIVQLTFGATHHLQQSQQTALDSRQKRIHELEEIQGQLIVHLFDMGLKLRDRTHEQRLQELKAARWADAQKRLLQFLPTILSSFMGRDLNGSGDAALIDGVVDFFGPEHVKFALDTLSVHPSPGAGVLATAISKRVERHYDRIAAEKAEEERLMRDSPGGYERGETDALGEAFRALGVKGAGNESGGRALPPHVGRMLTALNDKQSSAVAASPHTATVEALPTAATPQAEADAILDGLLRAVPPGQLGMMTQMLAAQGHGDLAQRLSTYAAKRVPQ
jgi:hypothetical protein